MLGAGPIGLLLLQVARVCGAAQVRVVEPRAARRQVALAMGADSVHEHHSEILELTAGRGEDYVLEATTSSDAPEQAAQIARIGGRVTLVGIPDGDRFLMTAANARRKGLIIKMSRRMGHVYPRAIELVRSGRVEIGAIATHHYAMQDAGRAFQDAHEVPDDFLKAVIYPGGEQSSVDQGPAEETHESVASSAVVRSSLLARRWPIATAAPHTDATLRASFLDRPGDEFVAQLTAQFTQATGIGFEVVPSENTGPHSVLDFTTPC